MDEHWDGGGYPYGLTGDQFRSRAHHRPRAGHGNLLGQGRSTRALAVARERSGRWFDPDLVDALDDFDGDRLVLGASGRYAKLDHDVLAMSRPSSRSPADDRSPRSHRRRVCAHHRRQVAVHVRPLASRRDVRARDQRAPRDGGVDAVRLRRAALLHDLGKLTVPNRILDKPGKLDAEEWAIVKQHPAYTLSVLERVPAFREFAIDAANHHEWIDGQGYCRGLTGDAL